MLPVLRYCESVAVRRSLGVLTVCAALEDVALGHTPGKPVGRVEDSTLLPPSSGRRTSNGYAPLPEEATRPLAMYVGNLERYQGIDLMLDGFRHALYRVPDASLVIVGGRDEDIQHYQGVAARLGIRPKVHFLGPRPVNVLPSLLRQADVLVSPRVKGLNTPMKIYSYLDSGTAVLATRLRTHTQVLDDRSAYLVDPEPEAFGAGLAPCSGPCASAAAGEAREAVRAGGVHPGGRAPEAGIVLFRDGSEGPRGQGVIRLWQPGPPVTTRTAPCYRAPSWDPGRHAGSRVPLGVIDAGAGPTADVAARAGHGRRRVHRAGAGREPGQREGTRCAAWPATRQAPVSWRPPASRS